MPQEKRVTVTTTDATTQVVAIATPVSLQTFAYELTLNAMASDARSVGYFKLWATGGANPSGTGASQQGQIGPSGSLDPAAPPWSAPGSFPPTWGITASVNVVGSTVTFEFNGGVGETVLWAIYVMFTAQPPL